jgi:hypothetical protein
LLLGVYEKIAATGAIEVEMEAAAPGTVASPGVSPAVRIRVQARTSDHEVREVIEPSGGFSTGTIL